MDPVLSRLRIVGGVASCPDAEDYEFCRDQQGFERLVSEIGVALAPPITTPARSVGASGISLLVDMTLTAIDANAWYWRKGSEGEGDDGSGLSGNLDPDPVLMWTHAALRKGLPLGFEVGASIGKGHATSLWALGLSLKWAIVEGFHSGIGALPDVALQVSTTRSMGNDDLTVSAHALDVLISKPLQIGEGFAVSPLLAAQLLFLESESDVVDLTPGVTGTPAAFPDAFAACRPEHMDYSDRDAPLDCQGPGEDFANHVQFDPVAQTRMRMFLGGQAQHGIWRFSATIGFDLVTPALAADPPEAGGVRSRHSRQVALTIAAGAAL